MRRRLMLGAGLMLGLVAGVLLVKHAPHPAGAPHEDCREARDVSMEELKRCRAGGHSCAFDFNGHWLWPDSDELTAAELAVCHLTSRGSREAGGDASGDSGAHTIELHALHQPRP